LGKPAELGHLSLRHGKKRNWLSPQALDLYQRWLLGLNQYWITK
jgi:hypothetical protein